jgi:hypothetical protein
MSALENFLLSNGSDYTEFNGTQFPTNPLVSGMGNGLPSSKLHSDGTTKGSYSLNGSSKPQVNNGYQQYIDGINNNLPAPSDYDGSLNGNFPSTPLASVPQLGPGHSAGLYENGPNAGALGF